MAEGVSSIAAAAGEPFSQVELSISCNNLKDLDHFSKSDPAVFLYEKKNAEWIKVGRTEVVDNNLNPKVCKFVQRAVFDRMHVYTIDSKLGNQI